MPVITIIPNFLPVDSQWQICLWYGLEIYQSFYQNWWQKYAKICQDKWKMKKGKKAWKAWKYWKYEKNQDFIYLPRQQCAFSKESSKYKGCRVLKKDFYTKFKPIFNGFGAVTWWEKNSISVVNEVLLECYFCLKERHNEHNVYYFKVNWNMFEATLKLTLKLIWSKIKLLQTIMLEVTSCI